MSQPCGCNQSKMHEFQLRTYSKNTSTGKKSPAKKKTPAKTRPKKKKIEPFHATFKKLVASMLTSGVSQTSPEAVKHLEEFATAYLVTLLDSAGRITAASNRVRIQWRDIASVLRIKEGDVLKIWPRAIERTKRDGIIYGNGKVGPALLSRKAQKQQPELRRVYSPVV